MNRLVRCLVVGAVLSGAFAARRIQEGPETPERLAAAAVAFGEARKACEADGGRLWGRPLWGPFMLVDAGTRRFVASEPMDQSTGNAAPVQSVQIGESALFLGSFPDNFSVANTAAEYAGRRWAMALWPLPDTPEARRQLLCHELWHRIQADLGLPLETPPCDHLDEEQGRVWLRLEMRALAAALQAKEATARRQAIADAVLFRSQRHGQFADGAEAERKLESSEGLAEYTGLCLSGRDDLAAWAADNLLQSEQQESLVRSFAYATGPAYGLLLDAAAPDWRSKLGIESNLPSLLAAAHELSAEQTDGAVDKSLSRYDGSAVRDQERQRGQAREARRRELTALLVDGPVLELPMGSDGRISFDPHNVAPLPPHGTVYPKATLTGPWGRLEASKAEVLMAPDWKVAFVSAQPRNASPDGRAISGPGWVLELESGWRLDEADGRLRVVKAD